MSTKNQILKPKDLNHKSLLTPEAERKKFDRKGSLKRDGRRRGSLTERNKIGEENINASSPSSTRRRPVSRDERAQIKFGHQVYSKAAALFESLKDSQNPSTSRPSLEFDNEFEKRRAFSLAFAAKRYETILKDVLLDSSFYSSYFKLETFHHNRVMVMLLDFYEHDFRFSESARKKMEDIDSKDRLDYIQEIQKAFFQHKIKLCSAFARNRIKACALTLHAMLSDEVKEQKESGSRHPLYTWVNPLMTDAHEVLMKLQQEGFILKDDLQHIEHQNEADKIFCVDCSFSDLLAFPPACKDDIYNSQLAMSCLLIPMSKPRYITAEIVKRVHYDLCRIQDKSKDLLNAGSSGILSTTRDQIDMEGYDVILTHSETGSLAAHICSFLATNKRLFIFGCHGNKHAEIENNLRTMGIKNYVLIGETFNNILPVDDRWSSVKIIICNPPCSKSGVVNMVDFIVQEGADTALALSKKSTAVKIRGFVEEQASTMRAAFAFSSVNGIVYSTFSVHPEENESLVERVMALQQNAKNRFEPVSIWDDLKSATHTTEKNCKYLKVEPSDEMDGFFVSLLQRKIKEDSVREVMERASKKGLVKKSRVGSSKGSHHKKKTTVAREQPPHVARRLSKSNEIDDTAAKLLAKDDDDRFKF